MYRETTDGIEVTVRPDFLDEESEPDDGRWFWAYTVVIANHSEETVQLESRYWRITNALGAVEEVSGPGVIGEQPVLSPGDSFQYTSGCPLNTPSGTMVPSIVCPSACVCLMPHFYPSSTSSPRRVQAFIHSQRCEFLHEYACLRFRPDEHRLRRRSVGGVRKSEIRALRRSALSLSPRG